MENPIFAYQNCTIVNPNPIAGNLMHTPSENADGLDRRVRPMQTDFFREVSLFNAHFGSEPESSRWAQFLPEYLRPGNLEDYLKQTKKPKLFGNNFWRALQESPGQDCNGRLPAASQKNMPTVADVQKDLEKSTISSQRIDHIRYSRDQLLQLRMVKIVSEDIMKIKQGIEVEFLGVKQMIEHGATAVVNSGKKRENGLTLEENKEEKGVSEKKKKRGMSDEKKAKKKMKERKKRAEKNRKLGVKRLKIQPIVKQKPVSHCRHYMHGRCYEGDKCKFSHDVVPLTKSKPCSHFSRQACLKGDDCPFDHQLSKYPCNNYVSTGYCNRGENCLFSHEITPKQDSVPPLGVIKPETKSLNQCPNSDSLQQVKNSSALERIPTLDMGKTAIFPFGGSANYNKQANVSQKPHFAFEIGTQTSGGSSKGIPTSMAKSSAQPFTVENTKDSTLTSKPTKTPKGLTFLNTAMDEKASQKTGSCVLSNQGTVNNVSNQKPNVVPFKFPSSTSSSSSFLNRLENAQVKNTSNSGQRSLLATLGFASKYDSGSKKLPLISTPVSGTQQTESPIKNNAGLGISSITSDMGHKKTANPFEL